MENYKATLQEYAQKLALPLPIYECLREGAPHLPIFTCSVTVNGRMYESSAGYKHKREAQQAAAQAAVEDLSKNSAEPNNLNEVLGKKLLSELLEKLGWPSPTFSSKKEGAPHCPVFTSTTEINGVTYAGGEGKNKKEAETKAAFVAFQAINTQVGGRSFHFRFPAENKENNDLKQPIKECKDVKSELKTITNNYSRKNQFLVGTTSHQAERASETRHAENIHVVGLGSRNSNVDLACADLMHNKLGRESLKIEQCQLNKESEDMIQSQEYGYEKSKDNKQVVQDGSLTECTSKKHRIRLEMESKKRDGKVKRHRRTD